MLAHAQFAGLVGLTAFSRDHQSPAFVAAYSISCHGEGRAGRTAAGRNPNTNHAGSMHQRHRPSLWTNNSNTLVTSPTRLSALSSSEDNYIDAIVEEKTAGLSASFSDDGGNIEEVIPLVSE